MDTGLHRYDELISGTGNRLAHGYIDVDLDIVWAIVFSLGVVFFTSPKDTR